MNNFRLYLNNNGLSLRENGLYGNYCRGNVCCRAMSIFPIFYLLNIIDLKDKIKERPAKEVGNYKTGTKTNRPSLQLPKICRLGIIVGNSKPWPNVVGNCQASR